MDARTVNGRTLGDVAGAGFQPWVILRDKALVASGGLAVLRATSRQTAR
jgi:hypothetical protein